MKIVYTFREELSATFALDTAYALPETCQMLLSVEKVRSNQPVTLVRHGQGPPKLFGLERRGMRTLIPRGIQGDFTIRYLRDWGDLHYGTCYGEAVGDATALQLARSSANAVGVVVNTADYYNSLIAMIHSGPGAGEVRDVVDHTVSAGSSSVEVAAWSVSPTDASAYCFLPPWPETFHRVLVLGALARCAEPGWRAQAQSDPEYGRLRQALLAWGTDRGTELGGLLAGFTEALDGDPFNPALHGGVISRQRGYIR